MKKSLFLAAAILSLVSCTRTEEVDIVSPSSTLTLIAQTETSKDTRTIVDSETFVFWEPGDEISVFSGNRCARFVTDLDIESPTASFTGDLPGWVEGQELWAVYPYSEEATFDGQTITTVLPPVQVARAESFGQGMNLAVAKAVENMLFFYNVGGGVRFSVLEEGIKRVVFEGRDGEELSGTIKIGFDENEFPKVQEIVSGFASVTLLPPEGQDYFDTDVWYYMVAIPGALEKGYKMTLVKDDEYGERFNFQSLSIKRSIYGSIMYADGGVEFDNPVMHFPETESEWAESIALTESLSDEIQPLIQGYKEELIDLDNLLKEVRNTFGILEAAVNEDHSVIMVMQMDSVCVNYLLRDSVGPKIINPSAGLNSTVTRLVNKAPESVIRDDCFISPSKKALILAPFHQDFREPLNDWKSFLEDCMGNGSVEVLSDTEAGISCFTEDFLGKFDFILISTHGEIGCVRLYGGFAPMASKSTVLLSSTRFSLSTVLNLLSGGIKPENVSILQQTLGNDSHFFLCMTPDFLRNKTLDGSAVVLSACKSANKPLVDAFLSNGARIVSGHLTETSCDADNIYDSMLLKYMSQGLSFQTAYQYILTSNKTRTVVDALKSITVQDDWGSLDIPNNYWLNNTDPFFIKDPFPYNLCHTTTNDVIDFSWDSNLDSFTVSWKDHLDGNDWKFVDYAYDVRYDLYIHDTRVLSDLVDKQATWTPDPSIVSDSWYVVAKIMEGDVVLESFKSEDMGFEVEHEAVDLGLSVKWATINLGSGRPEDPGDYFAWGETEPKSSFNWSNYKWYTGTYFTKYSIDPNNGFVDNLITLEPDDDAAHIKWGGKWRMPTAQECRELVSNCTWSYSTLNGRKGCYVTNKETGMSIFLPAGGYYSTDIGYSGNNISGSIWSSSLPPGMIGISGGNINSNYLSFGSSGGSVLANSRAAGRTIRAVCDY